MKYTTEIIIETILNGLDLKFVKEYRFHEQRKWRFDYCIPDYKIAIEIEGAVFQNGRHTRGKGYTADCEKYNAAVLLGYKILRYTTGMVKDEGGQIYEDLLLLKQKKDCNL